jgi:hypothetical protein
VAVDQELMVEAVAAVAAAVPREYGLLPVLLLILIL